MSFKSIYWALILASVTFIFTAFAGQRQPVQQPQQKQNEKEQQEEILRLSAELVVVDAVVLDKKGNPVRDLKKENFTILEDGVPQEIVTFDFEDISGAHESAIAAQTQPQTQDPITIAKSKPTETDRQLLQDKRLIILFFDLSSMPIEDLLMAQEAAVKFIDKQMSPVDLVSIVVFSTNLQPLHGFTNNKETLKAALEKIKLGKGALLAGVETAAEQTTDTSTAESSEESSDLFVPDQTEFNIFNTDRKLLAIESLAKMLKEYPEKKSLIHFSSGISTTGSENQAQLRSTIDAANKANMSIYPVDARGLVALAPGGGASRSSPRGGRDLFTGQAMLRQQSQLSASQETLTTIAEDTGGKAFFDSNDLGLVFEQVHKDVGSYYVLGYYSSNPRRDGRYRQIKVTVNVPGVAIHHRPGYFAEKEFARFTKEDREKQLSEAMTTERPFSDILFALEADYFRVADKRTFVPVALKMPGSEIPFFNNGEKKLAEFDFVAEVRGQKQELASFAKDTIRVRLAEQTYKQVASGNIQYDTGFYLRPGSYRLKFLVRENQTGKMGSFEQPLVIPDLSTEKLKMSSIVLSSQLEQVTPRSDEVANIGDRFPMLMRQGRAVNPLIVGGRKVVPNVTRVFSTRQNLYIFFQVYDPKKDEQSEEPRLAVALLFFKNGVKSFETPVHQINRFADRDGKVVNCNLTVPLEKFAPGNYTLQVNVIDQLAESYAFKRINFVVR